MALRPLTRDLLPADLHAAYDAQREALFRRRTLWVLGVFLFFQLTGAGMLAITRFGPGPGEAFEASDPRAVGPRYWLLLFMMIAFGTAAKAGTK